MNVGAGTALVAIAAFAARRARRSVWWSLPLAGFAGTWIPVARDLTEPLQLALLAASVVSGSAALGLLAGLAKETAGVAVFSEAARGVATRDGSRAVRFGAAVLALAAWVLFVRFGVKGATESTIEGQFLRPPGAPLLALADSASADPPRFALTAVAFAILSLAILRLRSARDGAAWGAALYAAVELGAGYDNWQDPIAIFRAMAGAVVLLFLSWYHSRDALGSAAVALASASGPMMALAVAIRALAVIGG